MNYQTEDYPDPPKWLDVRDEDTYASRTRCGVCGRFMKLADVVTEHIPDTVFTSEDWFWGHRKCMSKNIDYGK